MQQLPTSYFTHGMVYVLVLLSQLITPSPFFTVSSCPFSTSVSLFLHWACVLIGGETTNQPPVYKLVLNAMKEKKAEKGSREYCVGLGFQFSVVLL